MIEGEVYERMKNKCIELLQVFNGRTFFYGEIPWWKFTNSPSRQLNGPHQYVNQRSMTGDNRGTTVSWIYNFEGLID